jgi:hypothetical protein
MIELAGAHIQQNGYMPDMANTVAQYCNKASLPSPQETLGHILNEGRNLNRKSLCTKLLSCLEVASLPEEEKYYQTLIGLLLENQG